MLFEGNQRLIHIRTENLVIAGRPARIAADIPLKTNEFVDGVSVSGR